MLMVLACTEWAVILFSLAGIHGLFGGGWGGRAGGGGENTKRSFMMRGESQSYNNIDRHREREREREREGRER